MSVMKNKLYFYSAFTLALTLTLTLNSFSQTHKYIPFPDSNAIWVITNLNEFGQETGGYQYYLKGDTIINGLTYQKVFESGDSSLSKKKSVFFGGLRNDTLTRKVHFWGPSQQFDNLLYDFSLSEGDTVPKDYLFRYSGSVVTNIDTIIIKSNEHLVFYFSNGLIPCIEGIGSLAGPFVEKAYFFEGGHELLCFMLGENKEPYFTLPQRQCTLHHYTGIPDNQISQPDVKISPNPIVASSVIELTGSGDSIEQLIVYESTGRIVFIVSNPQSNIVQIGSRINAKGLYVFQIMTHSGSVFTGRMIK